MERLPIRFRHERFSLKEKRLLGRRVQTPELKKAALVVVEQLKLEEPDEAIVNTAVVSVNPKQREAFIDQVRANLVALTPELRKIAIENLKRLTSTKLDALKAALASIQAEQEPSTNAISNWWENSNWSPKNMNKETMITAGVVSAVAIGGILLFKKLFFGAKSVASNVKERTVSAARAGKTSIIMIGIMALTAIGGFFGLKYLKDAAMGMAKKQAEELYNAMLAKQQKIIDDLKTATGAERDKLMAQFAENRLALEQKAAELGKDPTSVLKPETQEVVGEVVDDVVTLTKRHVLPAAVVRIMEGVKFRGMDENTKSRLVAELMFRNKTVSMNDVLNCVSGDPGNLSIDIKPPFAITYDGDLEDLAVRERMATILLKFCYQHYDRLCIYLAKRDGISLPEAIDRVGRMNIETYIENVLGSFNSSQAIMMELDGGTGTIADRIDALDLKKYAIADVLVQEQIYTFAAESLGLQDEELTDVSAAELFRLSFDVDNDFGSNVSTAITYKVKEDDPMEKKILCKIFHEIAREGSNIHQFLLPAFHDTFPTARGGRTKPEQVQFYLMQRMSPAKAVRLFLYTRMMSAGNATGLFFLQLEVLKFIGDSDTGFLETKKKETMIAIADKLMSKGSEDFSKGWTDLDLGIPKEVFEKGWLMLQGVLSLGAKIGKEWYTGWLEWLVAGVVTHPKTVVGSTVASATIWKFVVGQRMNARAINFNLTQWAGAHETDALFASVSKRVRQVGTPILISQSDDIVKAASHYDSIVSAIKEVPDVFKRKKLFSLLRRASVSTHNSSLWGELASEMRGLSGSKAATAACDEFAKSWRLRSIVNRVLYRSGSIMSWLGLRKPVMLGFRITNSVIDGSVGRMLRIPSYLRRFKIAVAIKNPATRIARYGMLLRNGATVDELMVVGAKAADLITLADDLPIEGLTSVYAQLSEADKIKHATILQRVLKGYTPKQLAVAGIDLAELARVMKKINGGAAKSAIFSADEIAKLAKLAVQPEYLAPMLEEIATIQDDAVRIARLKNFSTLTKFDDVLLLTHGANPADLIAAGRPSQNIIKICVETSDDALRQAYMAELIWRGHGDDLIEAAVQKGAGAVDELNALVGGMDNVPATFVARMASSNPLDEAFRAGGEVAGVWLKTNAKLAAMVPLDDGAAIKFSRALSRCEDIVSSADEAAELLSNARVYDLLSKGTDGDIAKVVKAVASAAQGSARAAAVQRLAMFMSEFKTAGTSAVTMHDDVLRAIVGLKNMRNPVELANMIKQYGVLRKTPARLAKFISWRGEWYSAGKFSRGAVRLGVGMEVAMFIVSIMEYDAARAHVEQLKKDTEKSMKDAGYRKSGKYYVHPNGSKLEIKSITDVQNALDDPEKAMLYFQGAYAVGSVAMWAAAPQLLLGPMGLVLLGVQIVVVTAISIWNQKTNRKLLVSLPAPVLALLGTGKAVQESEADVTASASNWVISDGLFEGAEDVVEKELIRKKALFAMFHRSLEQRAATHPDIYAAVFGYAANEARPLGRENADYKTPAELYDEDGELFNGDYENVIRRIFAISLFQESSDDSVDWHEFRRIRTDEGTWDWENVSQMDWENVSQRAVYLYGIHKMEKNARAAVKAYEEKKAAFEKRFLLPPSRMTAEERNIQKEWEDELAILLQQKEDLESQVIFGVAIKDLPVQAGGKTYVEVMLADMERRLNAAARNHGSERHEMQETSGLFSARLLEGISPDRGSRYVNINLLAIAGLEGSRMEDPKMSYDIFLSESESIASDLKYVGAVGVRDPRASWFAQNYHYLMVQDYRLLLVQMPEEFDPGHKIRNMIGRLDKRSWKPTTNWDYAQMRTDQLHRVYKAIDANNMRLISLRYRYHDFRREDLHLEKGWRDTWRPKEFPVGAQHDIWDLRGYQTVFFTPRNEKGEYLKDSKGGNKELTFTAAEGTTTEWTGENLPEGMHGTLRCVSKGEGKYKWAFMPSAPSQIYFYAKNSYNIEQPGKNVEYAVVPPREEILHPSTREYIHSHWEFHLTMMVDGSPVIIRYPPEGVTSRKISVRSGIIGKQLEQYGVTMERVSKVNADYQEMLRDPKDGETKPYWTMDNFGWKFTIAPGSPVTSMEFSDYDLQEKDPYKERLLVLPPEEAARRIKERRDQVPERAIHLRESDRLTTYPYADRILIEDEDFEIELLLADGRIIRGDESETNELQRYIVMKPTAPTTIHTLEWVAGDWVRVARKNHTGWMLYPRNPDDITRITYTIPGRDHRTIIRLNKDGSVPEAGPADTREMPFLEMESSEAAQHLDVIVKNLGIQKHPTEDWYIAAGFIGRYYPQKDGRVYWTGGIQANGTSSPSCMYTAKRNKRANTRAKITFSVTSSPKTMKAEALLYERTYANQRQANEARIEERVEHQLRILKKVTGVTDFTFLPANRFIVETNQEAEKAFTGLYYFVGETLYRTDGRTDYALELVAAAAYKEGTWKEISDRGAGRHRMLILQTQFSLKKHEDGYYTQEGFDGKFYFLRDGKVHRTAGKRGTEELTAAVFDGQKWSELPFGSPEYDQQKWNEWERKQEGLKVLNTYIETLGLTKHEGGYYTLTGNTCRYYARLTDRKIYRSAGRTTGGTDLPPALYSGKEFASTSALPISEEVIKAYEVSRERSMLLKGGPEFAVTLTDADGKRTTVTIAPDSTSPVSIGTLGNLNKNTDGNWQLSLPDNSPVAEVEYVTSYGYRVRSPILQGEDEFVEGPDRRFAMKSNSFSVDDSLYNTVQLVFADGTTEQFDYEVDDSPANTFGGILLQKPDSLRKYLSIEDGGTMTHFRLKEGVSLRSCTFTKKKEEESAFSTDMKDAMTLEWSTAS